jgi:hypothetical protein
MDLERLRSPRKRTLFAFACVREVWHLLDDEPTRKFVEVSEAFADGRATLGEVGAEGDAASAANWTPARHTSWPDHRNIFFADAAGPAQLTDWAAGIAATEEASFADAAWPAALTAARQKQALLLDDIAGPDPLPDLSRTRTPTVVALAEAIYDQRSWEDMPILADALEEASCTDARVLEHLRGPGPHVRGCWALDTILAKPCGTHLERLRSGRKQRLFACACVREVWHLLEDERSRRAVEVAEEFADGRATGEELFDAFLAANEAALAPTVKEAKSAARATAARAATDTTVSFSFGEAAKAVSEGTLLAAAWAATNTVTWDVTRAAASDAAGKKQALLLEDIAGPDHLNDLSRARTLNVVALAEAIYQERRSTDLPVLGDALEKAGCQDAGILSHLRGPGPHVLGCHVLDLILQKE